MLLASLCWQTQRSETSCKSRGLKLKAGDIRRIVTDDPEGLAAVLTAAARCG
jgi:hypothetical protein